MARTKTINIATSDGNVAVQAQIIRLYVGNYQERFAIHAYAGRDVLTHADSGQRVGDLAPVKLRHATAWGTGGIPNDREAARLLIAEAVERNGADRVLSVLRNAPVINP